MNTLNMKTVTNIFQVGNVLDPHIRIEGKCGTCRGEGEAPGSTAHLGISCPGCLGSGQASALVRLSDILTTMGPAAVYVGVEGDSE